MTDTNGHKGVRNLFAKKVPDTFCVFTFVSLLRMAFTAAKTMAQFVAGGLKSVPAQSRQYQRLQTCARVSTIRGCSLSRCAGASRARKAECCMNSFHSGKWPPSV